jgi:hypothetical protein
MSMPMHLQVVVVSKDSRTAAIAASILRGDEEESIHPWISAAHLKPPSNTSPVQMAINNKKFSIEVATSHYFINAKRVDLWLALDTKSAEEIRIYVMHNGPAPAGFYRGAFPEAVVDCGFETPWVSSVPDSEEWLVTLEKNLAPWRERIWEAFRNSS